jgi:hypothetical protein
MNFIVNGLKIKDLEKISQKYDLVFEKKENVCAYI